MNDLAVKVRDVRRARNWTQTRGEWPADVKVFFEVMGPFLTACPDDERRERMRVIAREVVGGKPNRP